MWLVHFVLALGAVGGLLAFLMLWLFAYQEVRNIDEWSRQGRALTAFWFLDKKLLPKEHDHLRVTAMWCFFASGTCGGLLWFLVRGFA